MKHKKKLIKSAKARVTGTTASVVNFEVQRGITPTKFRRSKFLGNMHNYYISTKFHELLFSSFRGVALTNCVTDRTKTICLPTKVCVGGRHNTHQRNNKILLIWSIDYSMLQGYLNWMWSQSLTPLWQYP